MIENIKSSVFTHSRKKSVKARFGKQETKMKNSTNSVAAASFVTSNNELTDGFDPLVQNVLDLLPGTDTDLIKKCLKYYGQNVEQVINAFLENNLPEFQSDEPEM